MSITGHGLSEEDAARLHADLDPLFDSLSEEGLRNLPSDFDKLFVGLSEEDKLKLRSALAGRAV